MIRYTKKLKDKDAVIVGAGHDKPRFKKKKSAEKKVQSHSGPIIGVRDTVSRVQTSKALPWWRPSRVAKKVHDLDPENMPFSRAFTRVHNGANALLQLGTFMEMLVRVPTGLPVLGAAQMGYGVVKLVAAAIKRGDPALAKRLAISGGKSLALGALSFLPGVGLAANLIFGGLDLLDCANPMGSARAQV